MTAVYRRDSDVSQRKLIALLDMTNSFRSTEYVDKIYAMLGLLSPLDETHS